MEYRRLARRCHRRFRRGGIALWLAFHNDLADPLNPDHVLREFTRLRCVAVRWAQTTYDPRAIRDWIGLATTKHRALENLYGSSLRDLDDQQAHALFEAASPISHLTHDDPPVYAFYGEARGPLPADAPPGEGTHHINFGLRLKEQMDRLNIECSVHHHDEGLDVDEETAAFFARHLQRQ